MTTLWGVALGIGLYLIWSSFWVPHEKAPRQRLGWAERTQDELIQAGAPAVTPAALAASSVVLGVVSAVLVTGLSASAPIGAAFGVIAARAPFALVHARARRKRESMRGVWPEVVDSLASGIRAGLSLPEALSQVGDRGPEAVREPFRAFGQDFRASGTFSDSLDTLKARLADPVADRIIEALRITRDVGGTDVGRLLRTLSEFLREEARVRGELEARQSWTVNGARLAAAAPWLVLAMLATRPSNAAAFNSAAGIGVLLVGGASTVLAYRLMVRLGRLPDDARVLR